MMSEGLGSFDANGNLIALPNGQRFFGGRIQAGRNIAAAQAARAATTTTALPPPRPNFQSEEAENAREAGEEEKESDESDGEFVDDCQTADATQRGQLIRPSAMGDYSSSGSHAAFKNAGSILGNILGIVNSVRSASRSASTGTASISAPIVLTPDQVKRLEEKATALARSGEIPYDKIEDVLYSLVSLQNPDQLIYVLATVGINASPNILGNIDAILNLVGLDKITSLASILETVNAVANIGGSSTEGSGGGPNISDVANAALSTFAQFTGNGGGSGGAPAFGGIQNILNIGNQAISLATTIKGITQNFGEGSVPDLLQQITNLPNVTQQLLSNINQIKSTIQNLGNANIGALADQLSELNLIDVAARTLDRVAKQIEPIEGLANEDALVGDIREQLQNIQGRTSELQERLTSVLSEISSIQPPENFGEMIEATQGIQGLNLLNAILGQVPTIQVLARNPMLKEPTGIGMRFFGQSKIFLNALDQVFAKRVASFTEPSNAAGTNAFDFQSLPDFSGPVSLGSVFNRVITGTVPGPAGNLIGSVAGAAANTVLSNILDQKTADIANLLGVAANTTIEMRRPDNAIPFMISTAAALANETNSPFGTRVFSEGWQLANSVRNFIRDTQGRQ